jgi:hypothetical protein
MNNLSDCYEPYELVEEKKKIINKGKYLLKSSCCDLKSCENLIQDINDTKFKCNDIFGKGVYHELDEKGNIIGDTLCSKLNTKQKELLNFKKTAGKSKRKRSKRRTNRRRTNRRRSKRHRKY